MENKKKKTLPPYIMLCLIAVVMAFAIAKVYDMTKDTIDAAALASQAAARQTVMQDAADMAEVTLEEDSALDYLYEAYDASGNVIGYVGQITVTGFGGEIEVTVGMDTQAVITGISVGGANFSETSGLGAKTKEPAFTDQFTGMSGTLVLKQNIDSVTGASISSGAVVSGVNQALTAMSAMLGEDFTSNSEPLVLSDEDLQVVLPGASSAEWMGVASGIDGWWQADNGYVVRAHDFGEGLITVTMGFDENGVVTGIIIGDENFAETEGRGALVQETEYWSQFIGLSGEQAYGDTLDAISGATVTSDATLSAINACMTFDPSSFVALSADEIASQEAEEAAEQAEVDAESEASVTETEEETETVEEAAAEPDAETSSSIPEEEEATAEEAAVTEEPAAVEEATAEPDAETSSSIPEEEEAAAEEAAVTEEPAAVEEAAAEPDAETSSSIPEEEEAVAEEAAVTEEPAAVEEATAEPDAETSSSIPEEEEAAAEEAAVTEEPAAVEEATAEPDAETSSSIPEEEAVEEPAVEENASAEPAASAEPEASEEPAADHPSLTVAQLNAVMPEAKYAVWMGVMDGIDGWWRADNGIIIMLTNDDGSVTLQAYDFTGALVGEYTEGADGTVSGAVSVQAEEITADAETSASVTEE